MDALRPKVGPGPHDSAARAVQTLADPRLVLGQPGATQPGATPLGATVMPSVVGPAAAFESLHIDARGHVEQALQAEPTAVRPRVLLFLLELRDQNFAAAERIIGSLVREHPLDPDHLAHYAELELRRAELPKSKELAERALRIDPRHVDARRVQLVLDIVSGELAATGHAAPERLARVIEHTPEAPKVLFTLFQQLVAHHHLAEAMRLGDALLGVQPDNAALRNALIDLRIFTQPLGVPLYHLRQAGGFGLALLSIVAIAIYSLLNVVDGALAAAFLAVCLLVGAYAWSYPKWMRR